MEESSRRLSTVRVTQTESPSEGPGDEHVVGIRSRLVDNSADNILITADELFALFATLAGEIHRSTTHHGQAAFEQLVGNDVGIVDAATTFVGEGGSFSVTSLTVPPPDTSLVLKSVMPFGGFTTREEQTRLGAVVLELRSLSHRPLRNHKNIVKLLGVGWETDWADPTRKWPVLIQECAYGTLDDVLSRESGSLSYQHRLALSLGISEGLLALQACGIVHGDLKPANVLMYSVAQPGESDCRWLPKLADFGGSVLDIAEEGTGRLPMRSVPWQAPEWAEYLSRDGLLRTDLYSLGLTIWSIMANGASPDLNLADPAVETLRTRTNAYNDRVLDAYLGLSASIFPADVDRDQVEGVLAVTLRVDPKQRDLKRACHLLQLLVRGDCKAVTITDESSDMDPRYKPVTRLSHVENVLMQPDMLDTLSPAIQEYMRKRLIGVFKASCNSAVRSSAAFTLAVDALRHTEDPGSAHECMVWLIRSAQAGNQTAQSLVYRFSKGLNYTLPLDVAANLPEWIIGAAQRNYPAAQQDMHEVLDEGTCRLVWRRFRSQYGGLGWNRFASLYTSPNIDLSRFDEGLRDEVLSAREQPGFDVSTLSLDNQGDTILHFAASAGFEEVVKLWRAPMPVSVNAPGSGSETPLLIACRSGHGHVVRLLLGMGADPTIHNSNGDTPLHWLVAFAGDEVHSVTQALIGAGANVDAVAKPFFFEFAPLCDYEAGTALHRAVGKGNLGAVKALLACGASATSVGNREDRMSPIALAARFHYAEILDTLLGSLQDPLAASHPHAGVSLLAIAISGDFVYGERFSKMARHGSWWWEELRSTLDVICLWGGETHMRGFPQGMACAGTTPMLLASARHLPETVRYLLDNGCRPDVDVSSPYWLDGGRYTPLIKSVFLRAKGVFKLLLENGADATRPHVDEDQHDLPPLYVCAVAGHDDPYFAERLVAHGAGINGFKSPDGLFETPFACALRNRCFALAKWLLDHGADPHIEYRKGLMVELNHASNVLGFLIREQTRSSLACIDFLLREVPDASFTVSSERQYSVLHALVMSTRGAAEEKGNRAATLVFQTILAHFRPSIEQINRQDCEGRTAIWMAVGMGNIYVAEQLLKRGADPRVPNAQGVDAINLNVILMESMGGNPSHVGCSLRGVQRQSQYKLGVRQALGRLLEPYKA